MSKMIIGIDPGMAKASPGGIAFSIDPFSSLHADAVKMPDTVKGIWDRLESLKKGIDEVVCYVENVGFYRPGNSATSAVKFAKHVGHLEMALAGLQIPAFYVTPGKWMKATFGSLPKDKVERKRFIKNRMEQQYPHLKVILSTADALGIMSYAIEQQRLK